MVLFRACMGAAIAAVAFAAEASAASAYYVCSGGTRLTADFPAERIERLRSLELRQRAPRHPDASDVRRRRALRPRRRRVLDQGPEGDADPRRQDRNLRDAVTRPAR